MSDVIAAVGLNLAKNVFEVHGVDADGRVCVRRKLRRSEVAALFSELSPCVIGMEACASAHFWTREIGRLCHEVRLMPPAYVAPYVNAGRPTLGCGSLLRSGDPPDDAVRGGEERRSTGGADAAQDAGTPRSAEDYAEQRAQGASRGVGHGSALNNAFGFECALNP